MFALAGRLAPLIGKAAVKAVTKGGQMVGANPQITRDVAANAARSARQAVRGLEGAEALGTAVATTMSTGDPLRGVQAGVANVAGNIGVNMGLNVLLQILQFPKEFVKQPNLTWLNSLQARRLLGHQWQVLNVHLQLLPFPLTSMQKH